MTDQYISTKEAAEILYKSGVLIHSNRAKKLNVQQFYIRKLCKKGKLKYKKFSVYYMIDRQDLERFIRERKIIKKGEKDE